MVQPFSFRHEMLLYSNGGHGFVEGTLDPVKRALASEAGVLVAVRPERAQALREALGEDAERLRFADVVALARNPARLIPACVEFARAHAADGDALGIVEPVWPGRSAPELSECERHEALLNVAFDGGPAWRMLCSYDLGAVDDHVIEAARRTHPLLASNGVTSASERYACAHQPPRPFAGALPDPEGAVSELAFAAGNLAELRHETCAWATERGLDADGAEELVLAVDELAANSIRHGGGAGTLRRWQEGHTLLCEVRDRGSIDAPLTGRSRPAPDACSGRGLWLVNQLCDLVQIRSADAGTVVRVHKRLPGAQ